MLLCLYGHGDINVAHSAYEFIDVAEVVNASKICALTPLNFCGYPHA